MECEDHPKVDIMLGPFFRLLGIRNLGGVLIKNRLGCTWEDMKMVKYWNLALQPAGSILWCW